ncbi:LacI family DNA-binding transcriptional regulator [Paludisphaera mucosa]|uniref:LacI family DNA-binding transcriptional regulator n=1 Tax=Paludisphaera mucosa TaxID=3030827 RepID=A0ABT6FCY8_9BACT|nr:LacI family DNA-binding transcriptional regulator [Paludisphaera mucosa]MDG3005402.1 LacI family DNA-binding transcriptional regulator [Paludisphaera mucosa]
MGRPPTLSDVARLCGVAPSTVSRVLNRKGSFSATPAVRQKILDVAEQLGYVPNLAARGLIQRTSRVVSLFATPTIHVAEGVYEPLIEGVLEVLHASDYEVFFDLSAGSRRRAPFFRFDGALLLQSPRPEIVAELDRRRVPYVCVNETVGAPAAQVLADDRMGVRLAVEHLARLGHRRLAYANARATSLPHYSIAERHDALTTASKELGIELDERHDAPFASGDEFLREAVIDRRATVVLCYDHQIAVTLVGAAAGLGLEIPGDFSLICFNDVFPVSLLPTPLTAVSVPARDMGRTGAEQLLHSLAARGPARMREIRLPEVLVTRRSTAPPPSNQDRPRGR